MDVESAEPHHLDIGALPDLVLLKIFSNLDFFDLCKCARVCWRWYGITKESVFRKKIVVRNGLGKPDELPCLVEYHCTQHLEEFQLVRYHPSQMLRFPHSDLLKMLQRCTRLKKLVLMYCYLNYFSLSYLPSTVLHFSVRGSHMVPETFFYSREPIPFTLVCLDLSGVRQFLTSEEMHLVNRCKSLKALYLEGCDRINNAGIEAIAEILPQLHVIDVEGTDISNQGAYTVLNFCSNARDIYLGHTSIDDGVFEHVKSDSLPFLRDFCAKGTQITAEGLQRFMVKHCESHKENNYSRSDYKFFLEYNALFQKFLKAYLGTVTGCHHYDTHPEYGRNS